MRDHRDDGNPANWLGAVIALTVLVLVIILPQLCWWLITGDAMAPDVAP